MKLETKKKKQLANIKEWLSKSRSFLDHESITYHKSGEFYLLIAVEKLVTYLELDNETMHNDRPTK